MGATLGEREMDVMSTLWREGPGTVAELRDRLPVPLAYNTVLTILRNLEAKGFVGHSAEGRLFRYHAAAEEREVCGSALTRLVSKLFHGSPMRVVAQLVEDDALSPRELQRLQALLDRRLAEADAGETGGDERPTAAAERERKPR